MVAKHSKLWYLEKINLLKDLSQEELEDINRKTRMKTAKKGQFIYFPKDPSRVLFFLKKGRVKLGSYSESGKEIIKIVLYPGEIFGEMAITGETNRKDFAIALDEGTRMCTINVVEFQEILNANPSLSMKMTKKIGERLRNVERKLEDLLFKDARTRVINFMKEMANQYGKQNWHGNLVKHNLTHQEIAGLTATSRQTVTTVLSDLKEKDIIYVERNRFLIRSLEELR